MMRVLPRKTALIQRLQHLPYLRIEKSTDAVIRGVQATYGPFVKRAVVSEVSPHVFECRMPDPFRLAPLRRQIDLVVGVQIVGLLRRQKGRMWRDKGQEQNPGLFIVGALAQPADGLITIADVVGLIG